MGNTELRYLFAVAVLAKSPRHTGADALTGLKVNPAVSVAPASVPSALLYWGDVCEGIAFRKAKKSEC